MPLRQNSNINPLSGSTSPILESISDGVFTVDSSWRVTSFNRAAQQITGVTRNQALGKTCSEVFRASLCEGECPLRRTLRTDRPVVNQPAFIITAAGHRVPISISTAILRDEKGKIIGGVESFRDLSQVEELKRELVGRIQAGDLLSRSPLMRSLFEIIPVLGSSESTVLIRGETGTGKELFAHALHDLGSRKGKPFIAVNCAAFPEALLESELFGYKAGAFTGAIKDKPGRFALAEGGTLFLDEIAEIPLQVQVKLLRVLQDHVYEPLGGTTGVKAHFRLLTATHQDLAERVQKGLFRQDLYYRIHVIEIEIPPLRRRREDIPLLTEYFLERLSQSRGKRKTAGPAFLSLLMAHDYPGNVRELENLVEHAYVVCEAEIIEPRHLPREFLNNVPEAPAHGTLVLHCRGAEERVIRDALQAHKGDAQETAKALGLHRSTLYRKLRKLNIKQPRKSPSAK